MTAWYNLSSNSGAAFSEAHLQSLNKVFATKVR